jgi:hypothetical protein
MFFEKVSICAAKFFRRPSERKLGCVQAKRPRVANMTSRAGRRIKLGKRQHPSNKHEGRTNHRRDRRGNNVEGKHDDKQQQDDLLEPALSNRTFMPLSRLLE